MDKKSWIHNNQDKIVVIATIIFLSLLIIALIASEAHINKNLTKIAEEDFKSENAETMIIEDEETTKIIIFEPTTEEVIEKSTTVLSSSIISSKDDLLFTKPTTTPITKETFSSSNSSFSSASTIAFYYDDEEPVYVSAEEYYTICGVVMNETGYGSYEGCVAVAQSIRNQIIREKNKGNPYDIEYIRQTYQEYYTKKPNDLVRKAVTDVFYNHIVVTIEPIIAWCNGTSSWHSQQKYICSYDGNNFYALANKDW